MLWRTTLLATFLAAIAVPSVLVASALPEYEVVDRFEVPGGKIWGDVLIPAYRPDMPMSDLEAATVAIAKREGLDHAWFYNTPAARKANSSSSYNEAHPGVLEGGYLGEVENGVFRPSVYVYPEQYTPGTKAQSTDPSLPKFKVSERKKLNDALVLSVQTSAMDQILLIARHLVAEDRGNHFMVRVFFYRPGQAIAIHRIEWTEKQGFVQTF